MNDFEKLNQHLNEAGDYIDPKRFDTMYTAIRNLLTKNSYTETPDISSEMYIAVRHMSEEVRDRNLKAWGAVKAKLQEEGFEVI